MKKVVRIIDNIMKFGKSYSLLKKDILYRHILLVMNNNTQFGHLINFYILWIKCNFYRKIL